MWFMCYCHVTCRMHFSWCLEQLQDKQNTLDITVPRSPLGIRCVFVCVYVCVCVCVCVCVRVCVHDSVRIEGRKRERERRTERERERRGQCVSVLTLCSSSSSKMDTPTTSLNQLDPYSAAVWQQCTSSQQLSPSCGWGLVLIYDTTTCAPLMMTRRHMNAIRSIQSMRVTGE